MSGAIQRRSFLLGASAGLGSMLLPGRVHAARTAAGTVMVIGGSAMVGAVGRFIEDGLVEAGFSATRHAKSSTGLARPDFYDWPGQATSLYESESPIATVCMFGGNDGQGLHMGRKADPQWIRWQEEGWSEEYGRRVQQFADAVAPNGEHVFWIGMPVMRSNKLKSRMERMNGIFQSNMEAREGGHFIDTWSVLADAKGNYTERLLVDGKRVTVRAGDGVHYTRSGAKVLANHVVPQVAAVLSGT